MRPVVGAGSAEHGEPAAGEGELQRGQRAERAER